MIERIEELFEYETTGDPVSGLKWTRKTTEKIALVETVLNYIRTTKTKSSLTSDIVSY